jgi:hypothetical protein
LIPTEVGIYDSPGPTYAVYVSGNYAYLAEDGLRVVDISTPLIPTEVGFYDSPGSAYAVYVIAVALFVSSSWDNISGVVQWRIVAAFAFAFLGMGEIFVRGSTVLAPAGETFRGVGMVLMPFVALAYQRFVLDGNASAFFWFMTTLLLVAFYYAFYYISAAKRLAAYLSVLSLGTLALLLPNVLELGNIWQAHALLLMSAILFITIWQVEPDGRALPKRFWSGTFLPLEESHLIAGLLYALASWLLFFAFTIESPSATRLYLTLHTLLFIFLSTWFASDLLAGAASLLTYSLTASLIVAYLPASAAPLVTFALALLILAIVPYTPRKSRQWLEPLALLTALFAPTTAIQADILGASTRAFFGLSMTTSSQLSLFLSTILFAVWGWQHNKRYLIAYSGLQLYLLYSGVAIAQDITNIQAYSVPLSMLLFAFSNLFAPLEVVSVLTLLLPTTFQTLAQPDPFYSFLLGGYGILLLILGISFTRPIPRAAGIIAILLAALPQLWKIFVTLPPSLIIAIVGLAFISVAIFLTLQRDKGENRQGLP